MTLSYENYNYERFSENNLPFRTIQRTHGLNLGNMKMKYFFILKLRQKTNVLVLDECFREKQLKFSERVSFFKERR